MFLKSGLNGFKVFLASIKHIENILSVNKTL